MNPYSLRLIALLGLLFAILSGCTHYVYGVPRDQWRQMNTYDRAETRRVYELRHPHVEHVYVDDTYVGAGEATVPSHHYPQLVYLHLSGGFFVIRGHQYAFQPQAFQIRHGETREIVLISSQGRLPHRAKLWVRYFNGQVMLGDGRRYLHTVAYRDGWHRGEHYRGVRFHGDVHLENVNLFIGPRPLSQQPQYDRDIPSATLPPVYKREPNYQDEVPPINGDYSGEDDNDGTKGTVLPVYKRELNNQGVVPPINGDHSGREDNEGANQQGEEDNGRIHQESAEETKARLKKERREKNKAERDKAMQGMTREEKIKLREERRELNRQKKAEREKAKKEKVKKEKVKKEKVKKEKVKKEKVKKEKVKKEKVKKEEVKKEEVDKRECVDREKGNGKKKNGLPYCDE